MPGQRGCNGKPLCQPSQPPHEYGPGIRPKDATDSLRAVESRPAQAGEKLVSTSFRGSSTSGFAAQDNRNVAVCLLPGTELGFDEDVRFYHRWIWTKSTGFRVARFCNVDTNLPDRHHDALEFPDGRKLLRLLRNEGLTTSSTSWMRCGPASRRVVKASRPPR
jgi:hypothetical protein